jgi:predicted  nucleic acid-binding Zn-ribbon protein
MDKTPIDQLIFETELSFYNQESDIPALEQQLKNLKQDLFLAKDKKEIDQLNQAIIQTEQKKQGAENLIKLFRIKLDYLYGLRNDNKTTKSR